MKKTNSSNPLKFFNDAKAARNKSFSKSLIKAQDGFGVNDTMNDDLINKAGSTGGYKVPTPTWSAEESANISKAISGLTRPKDRLGANAEKMMALQGEAANSVANSVANANRNDANQPRTYQKMGGITKTTVVNRIAGAKKNARKKK
jgi:hypothetical protein